MQLPAELRDFVIDLLQDDAAALQACSLTCRAWLPRSRHHIFRRVQIAPGRRGLAFRALLDGNPGLGKYVQDVEISGSSQDLPVERLVRIEWPTLHAGPVERSAEGCSASWLENFLPDSVEVLQNVSSLRLVALLVYTELVDVLQRRFPAVKKLVLNKCRFAAFKELCELAHAMSRLEDLQVAEAYWLRPTLPCAAPQSSRIRLNTLILSDKIDAAVVLNWIVSRQLYTELSSMSCYISGYPSAVAIRNLLTAAGPVLRHLAIGFADLKDPTGNILLHRFCVNNMLTMFWSGSDSADR